MTNGSSNVTTAPVADAEQNVLRRAISALPLVAWISMLVGLMVVLAVLCGCAVWRMRKHWSKSLATVQDASREPGAATSGGHSRPHSSWRYSGFRSRVPHVDPAEQDKGVQVSPSSRNSALSARRSSLRESHADVVWQAPSSCRLKCVPGPFCAA